VLKKRHNLFAVDLEREFRPKRKQNRLRKGEKLVEGVLCTSEFPLCCERNRASSGGDAGVAGPNLVIIVYLLLYVPLSLTFNTGAVL
jgi:hypothetical protein